MTDERVDLKINVTEKTSSEKPKVEPRDWYPSSQAQELVRKFHEAFDEPIGHHPQSIGPIRGFLRVDLIKDALEGFEKAVNNDSLLDQYDTLIEILLQTYGTLVEMGVDAGPGKREVMRSKMTMLNETFDPADLFSVLMRQGWRPSYEEYLKHHNLKDPREVLQALAGRPDIYEEVVKFIPEENPEGESLLQTKRGVRFDGVDYFADEPHDYTPKSGSDLCVCGLFEARMVHHSADQETVDWAYDMKEPPRKDNFKDAIFEGWVPTPDQQLAYENYRLELKERYPSTKWVDDKLQMITYRNGELDVDWDFEANAPRVKKE